MTTQRLFNEKMPNTYATVANAEKAVAKKGLSDRRHVIAVDATGRYFAVFIGEGSLHVIHMGFAVAA